MFRVFDSKTKLNDLSRVLSQGDSKFKFWHFHWVRNIIYSGFYVWFVFTASWTNSKSLVHVFIKTMHCWCIKILVHFGLFSAFAWTSQCLWSVLALDLRFCRWIVRDRRVLTPQFCAFMDMATRSRSVLNTWNSSLLKMMGFILLHHFQHSKLYFQGFPGYTDWVTIF